MRKFLFLRVWVFSLIFYLIPSELSSQIFTIGAPSPAIGSASSFTALIQFMQFDVLDPQGVVLDSCDIYPTSAIGQPFTIVVQNSAQVVIASVSGVTSVSSGQPQRIGLDLHIPQGAGYRWGFSVNPGMTRNSTGAVYPYTVPGLMSITGNTFNPLYYYFFYNIRIRNTASPTDAALTSINSPGSLLCNGLRPINVTLKNIGPNELIGTTIKWKVNSVAQTPYQWSGSLNVNDSIDITIGNYEFLATTIYDLEIYSELPNGQLDSNNINDTIRMLGITAIESPTGSVSSTGSTPTICSGEPIAVGFNLTGVSPWTVKASFGNDTQIISNITNPNYSGSFTPQLTGLYLFTVTDATTCSSLLTGSVNASVNPTPNLIISNDTLICKGEEVNITVTGGQYYAWSNGAATSQMNVSPNTTTTYTVTAYNSNLTCSSNASVTVNIDGPVLNLGPDRTECAPSYILEAGNNYATYLWHNGLQTPQITLDTIGIGLGQITASLTVTTLALGCELNDTVKIQFADCTNIDETVSNYKVNVYPNPNNGNFVLDLTIFENTDVVISIYDALGKKVYSELVTIDINGFTKEYNFGNFDKGIYLLSIKTENRTLTRRLIIQ